MQCLHAICNAYMHHAMPTCTMQCLHALCNAYMHFNQHCSDIHPFIDFHNHSEFATHFRNTMHSKYTITPPFLLPFIQSSHHHPPFILLITNNYEILQPPPPLPFRLQLPSPFPSSSSPSLQLPSPLPFILLPFPSSSSPSLQLPPLPFSFLLPLPSDTSSPSPPNPQAASSYTTSLTIGMPISSMLMYGSGEITERAAKSTRLPIMCIRNRPSFFSRILRGFLKRYWNMNCSLQATKGKHHTPYLRPCKPNNSGHRPIGQSFISQKSVYVCLKCDIQISVCNLGNTGTNRNQSKHNLRVV